MLNKIYNAFKDKDLTIKDFHELSFEEQDAWKRLVNYIETVFAPQASYDDGYEAGYSDGFKEGLNG